MWSARAWRAQTGGCRRLHSGGGGGGVYMSLSPPSKKYFLRAPARPPLGAARRHSSMLEHPLDSFAAHCSNFGAGWHSPTPHSRVWRGGRALPHCPRPSARGRSVILCASPVQGPRPVLFSRAPGALFTGPPSMCSPLVPCQHCCFLRGLAPFFNGTTAPFRPSTVFGPTGDGAEMLQTGLSRRCPRRLAPADTFMLSV